MGLDHRLDVSIGQGIHLTHGLMQGLSVLGMSAMDLSEYARDRVEDNPMFDDDTPPDQQHPLDAGLNAQNASIEEVDGIRHAPSAVAGNGDIVSVDPSETFELHLVYSQTLEEHLLDQLRMEDLSKAEKLVGEYLIGCVDDNGFLAADAGSVAKSFQMAKKDVSRILGIIQGFEPAGVAARNLSERLILQLERCDMLTPISKEVIEGHLEDLGNRRFKRIARETGIDESAVAMVLNTVRTCDPYPCAAFGRSPGFVWPEIVVESHEDGYSVRLQDFRLPNLAINERYRALACDKATPRDTRAYLKAKLSEAEGLVEGISRRRTALFKVACCIVEAQQAFLADGPVALRPLSMARVAELADLSESSVSRLVNGNYMQTPQGVLEMRYFFQRGLSGASDGAVSSESVKALILSMVQAEDPASPLGDQEIAEALAARDISISRRTANKYRTALGIPPKSKRGRKSASAQA